MAAAGIFLRDIARDLGRTQQAVHARALKIGVKVKSAPMRRTVGDAEPA